MSQAQTTDSACDEVLMPWTYSPAGRDYCGRRSPSAATKEELKTRRGPDSSELAISESAKNIWEHTALLYRNNCLNEALINLKCLLSDHELPSAYHVELRADLHILIYINKCIVYMSLGKLSEAAKAIDIAMTMKPNARLLALGAFILGCCTFQMSVLSEAADFWRLCATLLSSPMGYRDSINEEDDEKCFNYHDLGLGLILTRSSVIENLKVLEERSNVERRTAMTSIVQWQINILAPDMFFGVPPIAFPLCHSPRFKFSPTLPDRSTSPSTLSPWSSEDSDCNNILRSVSTSPSSEYSFMAPGSAALSDKSGSFASPRHMLSKETLSSSPHVLGWESLASPLNKGLPPLPIQSSPKTPSSPYKSWLRGLRISRTRQGSSSPISPPFRGHHIS